MTHGFDPNERFVPLDFVPVADFAFDIVAPANANIAPPGYYMLFVVSDQGVPSVAKFVQVKAAD